MSCKYIGNIQTYKLRFCNKIAPCQSKHIVPMNGSNKFRRGQGVGMGVGEGCVCERGVLKTYFKSSSYFADCRMELFREAIGPSGSNCFSRGPVPEFLRNIFQEGRGSRPPSFLLIYL